MFPLPQFDYLGVFLPLPESAQLIREQIMSAMVDTGIPITYKFPDRTICNVIAMKAEFQKNSF